MKITAYLGKLQGNARVCTALFPLWAVPYTVYISYLSLYLQSKGMDSSQIGTIMIISNVTALLSSVIAGTVVDRMGRKASTFVFDLISSALPALLFLVFPTYSAAILAMAFSGLNRIMSIGYYALMVEDGDEENGVVSMNLFNVILLLSGFFIPIAGFVVAKLGIVSSERWFLGISVVCMVTLTLVRNHLTHETEEGERIRLERKADSNIIDGYKKAGLLFLQKGEIRGAVLINALVYTYYGTATTASLFFATYYTGYLGFSASQYGVAGGVYTFGTLVSMVCINPHLDRDNLPSSILASCLVSLAGFLLLIAFPASTPLIMAGTFITALGYGVLKTAGDSILAITPAGDSRTTIYALAFMLSSILTIIVLKILTVLYTKFAGWLLLISGILVLAIACLAIILRRRSYD